MLALFFLSYLRIFESYEFQTYDTRCRLRGPRPISDKIVFVDIWDDTLQALGAWPFDRRNHAALIQVLSRWQARAVSFDIIFTEPRDGDDLVVRAAKAANNVYFVEALKEPVNDKGVFVSDQILDPLLPAYRTAAKGVGHINAPADRDGKRRKTIPVIFYGRAPYFHISLRMAMDILGISPGKVKLRPARSVDFSDKLKLPLDEDGYFAVNYARKWEEGYPHYSYRDILASYQSIQAGEKPILNPAQLKGKICFVGLTSTGSHDTEPVPIQNLYPLVGQHANILNSILTQDFIRRMGRVWNATLLCVFSLLVGWTAFLKKIVVSFLRVVLILSLFIVSAVFVFIQWGFWVDLFLPVASAVIIYAVAVFVRTIGEMKKRESMEKELKIASQIQQSFLPGKAPAHAGIQVAVYMKPAKEVGGDLYDFLKLNDGSLGVMLGDVSGKGTPAALFMAKVVSEFKFSAREKTDPSAVLVALNDSISSESTGGLFVTLTYAVFDLNKGKMRFSNGGHLPLVAVTKDGKNTLLSAEEGMPIGILPGARFANSEVPLNEGDIFIFYSDGVSEARNKKKEEYTVERLQSVTFKNKALAADRLLERTVEELHKFMGKAEQHDDITLIIAKVGTW